MAAYERAAGRITGTEDAPKPALTNVDQSAESKGSEHDPADMLTSEKTPESATVH